RSRGLPTKLAVSQVMETSLVTVELQTPIAQVLTLLLSAPFRALPVVDEGYHLRGIISTGDLIAAGLLPVRRGIVHAAQEWDQETRETIEAPLAHAFQSPLTAQDVMNRTVRTIRPEISIREAAGIMIEAGLKRLPVVD